MVNNSMEVFNTLIAFCTSEPNQQCQNRSKPEDTAREEEMFRCLEDCKHLIKLECYYVVH